MKRLAAIGAIKLSLYLKEHKPNEKFNNYSEIIDLNATNEKLAQAQTSLDISKEEDAAIRRIYYLSGRDNPISETLVELGCLRYLYPKVSDLLEQVAIGNGMGVTMETAFKVSGLAGEITDYTDILLEIYFTYEMVMVSHNNSDDFLRTPLYIDSRLSNYFYGYDVLDNDLFHNARIEYIVEPPEAFGYEERLSDFAEHIIQYGQAAEDDDAIANRDFLVVVSGEKGSGRKNAVRFILGEMMEPLLFVDFDFLMKTPDPHLAMKKVIRESFLLMGCICIHDVYKNDETAYLFRRFMEQYQLMAPRPLFITCDSDVKLRPALDANVFTFDIGKCTAADSLKLWSGMLAKIPGTEVIDVHKLASKMTLTAGQIKKITDQIYAIKSSENRLPDEHEIYKLCYQVLDDGRYDSIKRVESTFTLDDLKFSENNMSILRDICDQVENRQKVYDDWKMSKKYAYGRCISVILAGPPGTGKTMAVHALSNELGLELYKVDLSQIADKYVGETEKRLEEVFVKAEKSNMILFFDEADAIMGKRSDTKDSHDKIANTQIAFILQRMEEYDGIVILATNYLQNIDQAFMRRIKYVLNVGLPEAETRKEIWINAFAPEVPIAKDVDFDYLAEELEISGGNIKNIVLNATFLAAAENSPVTMFHIMKAVVRENTKDKRGVITENYGKYAYLAKSI